MERAKTVAWCGMGTVTSSRKRNKSAATVARKRPGATASGPLAKGPGGRAQGGEPKAQPRVAGSSGAKAAEGGGASGHGQGPGQGAVQGHVRAKEAAGKAVAKAMPAPAAQAERSPPALPIPIASFTF
jgi:hypothetical protein